MSSATTGIPRSSVARRLIIPTLFSENRAPTATSTTRRHGLQERSVRVRICDIMEGGKAAFKQRYKRILEDLEPRS